MLTHDFVEDEPSATGDLPCTDLAIEDTGVARFLDGRHLRRGQGDECLRELPSRKDRLLNLCGGEVGGGVSGGRCDGGWDGHCRRQSNAKITLTPRVTA